MADGNHVRERSLWELVVAAVLIGFLVGFVFVLCLGNYYRAKRAMERQRERRLRTQAGHAAMGSPHSLHSSATESTANTMDNINNHEKKYLLERRQQQLPELPRRRGFNAPSESPTEDLLLFPDRDSEQPKIIRV
jgi:hypothetical protein